MKDNTGRIYELLKIIKDKPNEDIREALHKAWPVSFQITQLPDEDYEKFKLNLQNELDKTRDHNLNATHGDL